MKARELDVFTISALLTANAQEAFYLFLFCITKARELSPPVMIITLPCNIHMHSESLVAINYIEFVARGNQFK